MANIIYARVMQKTATLDEWMSSDLVLLDGEQAFVVSSDGSPINFKIGDGTKTFSELPFWIQYDQAQYISIDSNTLPTPTQDVGYSLVGSGTYTRAGQSDVVVPSGHMGILNWDGSVWYLGSSVEMPEQVADGTVELGDDRAISGDTAYRELMRRKKYLRPSKNLFDKDAIVYGKWINRDIQRIQDTVIQDRYVSDFIPVEGGKSYRVSGWYVTSVSQRIVFLKEKDYEAQDQQYFEGVLTFVAPEDGYMVIYAQDGLSTDYKNTIQIELGTVETSYEPYVEIVKEEHLPIFDFATKDSVESLPLNSKYSNNFWTQQNSLNFASLSSGGYGNYNAIYNIPNATTNGIFHISFKFRFRTDVNVDDDKIEFFRMDSPNNYLSFYIHRQSPTQFSGGEEDGLDVNTRSPLPYYRSRFGVESDLGKTPLNRLLSERTYKYQRTSENFVRTLKPLVGDDAFSIKITAVDGNGDVIRNTVTSTEAQQIYERWKDAYLEVQSDRLVIINDEESFSREYLFSSYGTLRVLFEAMYNDINGTVINGARIDVADINVASFDTNTTSSSLLKHRFYLSTQYQRLFGSPQKFYDSFPAYIPLWRDENWHTFEMFTTTNKDELLYCIDGQYQNARWDLPGTDFIENIKSFVNDAENLLVGGEDIQVRDLEYEFNEISGVTPCRVTGTYNTVIFSSKMHPLVWNFFGHDLYKSDYSGGVYADYTSAESDGGKIPDDLFYTDGTKGDDFPTKDRAHIYQPHWLFANGLLAMHRAGFKPITHKQYIEYMTTGYAPYERCYVIGFDDFPTYIYANRELKNVFTKFGCKPYFAIELGWYVDEDAPTTSYDASDFIMQNNDTNEHRLELQRRLQALQHEEWGVELHGSKEGFVFRGRSYFEMVDQINEALKLSDYLGLRSSAWCIAGNFQTPNLLKLFEHGGIELATSTVISPSAAAFTKYYAPRTLMPSSYARQRLLFPLDV